ncbi:MAG: type II toxin-antitoxin system VapC family toxin [Planctomycetes bacterium]|nr:type II toxin-antitoxin system VapC family toxin [Planctomycetota bacterium]MCG2682631.1 type II toxin-antitoxin system VapC family toxin [Planctomycetales bacterium]
MKPVFLDASGLIAVANADDQWHERAESAWRELVASNAPLVTTSLVLFELGDGLPRVDQRPLAIQLYDRLRGSPRVQILSLTSEQESAAWDLFRQRPDKDWGATDCASFVVMTQLGIEEALTVDHHFEQAGFRRLIRS